jgi:UPF0716 family protein affecting phage T7 exclusion
VRRAYGDSAVLVEFIRACLLLMRPGFFAVFLILLLLLLFVLWAKAI